MRLWIAFFFGILMLIRIGASDSSSIRLVLTRGEDTSPMVYYFAPPEDFPLGQQSYPILLLCDGSDSRGKEKSVLLIRDFFSAAVHSLHVGYVAIEKYGMDGSEINSMEFWNHYTRSQRIRDHLQLIHHFEDHPPDGWDGRWIFVGVSEGGALVTTLASTVRNTLATINWSGASDWNWADEFWQLYTQGKKSPLWIRLYDGIPRWAPFSLDVPSTREEFDAILPTILANPSPDLWMGGVNYLYHGDALQLPQLDYTNITTPILVVADARDCLIDAADQFVEKGLGAGAPITYLRVDNIDRSVDNRSLLIEQSFKWLQQKISVTD